MDNTQPDSDSEPNGESNLALILKELRELRKDFGQQLSGIKEDISKIGKRVEEAEERINGAETRIQSSEDVLTELTPFPARLRVFYEEGTVVYGSVEEATMDMAKRGIPVTVVKKTTSLLDQISRMTWRSSEKRGNRDTTRANQGFKERLHAYRRQDT
ncbi:hypothetical protein NQZ68_034863 [Dissostichus eleginoides]|nr:hypothetical protein NQZ68_034863 [Dissostichus eleginoides]